MKTLIWAVMLAMALISPLHAQGTGVDRQPQITVNGEAVVYAVPDRIIISFGIETWDFDIAVAKKKNNDIMRKAVMVITECGVPEREIQTDYLSIEPRYKN